MIKKKVSIVMSSIPYKKQLIKPNIKPEQPKKVKPVDEKMRKGYIIICSRTLNCYELPIVKATYEDWSDLIDFDKN
jgi:hypothetical protein